ncbi:short-chain dehydrogenase [Aquimarina algicola]|uniref:Short-chain dehydrogenase n=1 Tax=Aquimarina algicola TaxID=2589995 RepID=A0A504JMJ1_9FLAO|nr:short-chain dehydrogenase [Aquimarina algicola]TPN87630.1 short-chain dehydrogenase [Aquimarina algicola]
MKHLYLLLSILLFISCSDEKTDEALLQKDKEELIKQLDSDKVLVYKFGKISIRSSALQEDIPPEFEEFKTKFDNISSKLAAYDTKNNEELSIIDYISMYRDYRTVKGFVEETDEDIFPTLTEALYKIRKDTTIKAPVLNHEDKIITQNIEHALLSVVVLASRDLGKEISLYESSKTHPELLPDGEIKALMQFFRGFLFFEKKLYYLSEDEISRNIEWLNNNPDVDLPLLKIIFQWGNLDSQKAHTGLHALNHLFRGFDRLMMEREIDEERALLDFEEFLKDAEKIGLDNEITWSVETYLYLKQENNEKAITSLQKLKTSTLLSAREKETIDQSIEYLNNREPDKVLNGIYDKYFLSKIATKYIIDILSKVDWKQLMKSQDIPYTDEIFKIIDTFNNFIENIDKYSSMENLENATDEIKDQSSKLWDRAKGLLKEKDTITTEE